MEKLIDTRKLFVFNCFEHECEYNSECSKGLDVNLKVFNPKIVQNLNVKKGLVKTYCKSYKPKEK